MKESQCVVDLVRVARIELASLAWKAGILATIRHPRTKKSITAFVLEYKHMRFQQYLSNISGDDAHTNSQNATGSPQSFEARMRLEKNRSVIRGYRHSRIGQSDAARQNYRSLRERAANMAADRTDAGNSTRAITRQEMNSGVSVPPATGFKEPPSRGYNPYV